MLTSSFKIIADSGATKTDWMAIDEEGNSLASWQSPGINPAQCSDSAIHTLIGNAVASAFAAGCPDSSALSSIWWYGAGCATTALCNRMADSLSTHFQSSDINVCSDLLGAARALFRHSTGIACILGTGSNSCLYDGSSIIRNVPSLGFILGDEGGGAAIGKRVIADIYKGLLPEKLAEEIIRECSLSIDTVINRVYREDAPAAFLASILPTVMQLQDHPAIANILDGEIIRFFERNLSGYPTDIPLGFVGSLACALAPRINAIALRFGRSVDSYMARPISGLASFHSRLG